MVDVRRGKRVFFFNFKDRLVGDFKNFIICLDGKFHATDLPPENWTHTYIIQNGMD